MQQPYHIRFRRNFEEFLWVLAFLTTKRFFKGVIFFFLGGGGLYTYQISRHLPKNLTKTSTRYIFRANCVNLPNNFLPIRVLTKKCLKLRFLILEYRSPVNREKRTVILLKESCIKLREILRTKFKNDVRAQSANIIIMILQSKSK